MSYLGDATIGEKVNVGAGTITANYDGRRKHKTIIEDGVFLGVDTMLVAPVTVGEGRQDRRRDGRQPRCPGGQAGRGCPRPDPRAPQARGRTGDVSGPIFEIGIIVVLILLNGVFSATEMALVTMRKSRLDQMVDDGRRGAKRILRLKQDPGRFLAVIQIGITFIGFLAAAFAGVSLSAGLETSLEGIPLLAPYAGVIALFVVTGILTIFTIIFGELVPKQIGLAHAERVAFLFGPFVDVLGRVFRPARRVPDRP